LGDIVNLRRARKDKARQAAETAAAANRAQHGRSKPERTKTAAERAQAKAKLDGAKREPAGE
jgi:hypothetical protein